MHNFLFFTVFPLFLLLCVSKYCNFLSLFIWSKRTDSRGKKPEWEDSGSAIFSVKVRTFYTFNIYTLWDYLHEKWKFTWSEGDGRFYWAVFTREDHPSFMIENCRWQVSILSMVSGNISYVLQMTDDIRYMTNSFKCLVLNISRQQSKGLDRG